MGKEKLSRWQVFLIMPFDTYLPEIGSRWKTCRYLRPARRPQNDEEAGEAWHYRIGYPGVSINDNVLNYKENNFLAAVHFGKASCGVAFLDISTGEFLTAEGPF